MSLTAENWFATARECVSNWGITQMPPQETDARCVQGRVFGYQCGNKIRALRHITTPGRHSTLLFWQVPRTWPLLTEISHQLIDLQVFKVVLWIQRWARERKITEPVCFEIDTLGGKWSRLKASQSNQRLVRKVWQTWVIAPTALALVGSKIE